MVILKSIEITLCALERDPNILAYNTNMLAQLRQVANLRAPIVCAKIFSIREIA